MSSEEARLGFVAALLHDARKIDLGPDGRWHDHENLRAGTVSFANLLGDAAVDIASAHGELPLIPAPGLTSVQLNEWRRIREDANRTREWSAYEQYYRGQIEPALKQEAARAALAAALAKGVTSRPKLALLMADRWQKAMYLIPERDEFDKLRANPIYLPFYGRLQQWDARQAGIEFESLGSGAEWKKSRPVPAYSGQVNLLGSLLAQKHFRRFPHTTYIPHDSLATHQRFVALLYLLVYERIQVEDVSPLDLTGLEVTLLRVAPDPLALLYRLREVDTARQAVFQLRRALFGAVFRPDFQPILPDLTPDNNPFEFAFGDELLLVTDPARADRIEVELRKFVEADWDARSLQVDRLDFALPNGWNIDAPGKNDPREVAEGKLGFFANPAQVQVRHTRTTFVADVLAQQAQPSDRRCERCERPAADLTSDEVLGEARSLGDLLCPECLARREQSKGVLRLDKVAELPGGGEELLGFVFLSLPEDLRQHARQVAAERLIPDFNRRRGLEHGWVTPSPSGFFEYLQAIADLDGLIHDKLEPWIGEVKKREPKAAHILFASATQMAFVLRWDYCWPFVEKLNIEREPEVMKLDTSLTVVFCHPKQPFWSLMNRYARFRRDEAGKPVDVFYDATGGTIVMFTIGETNDIRRLAQDARNDGVTNAQLNQLVQMALNTEFHELELELDARAAERKMGKSGRYPGSLKAALGKLTYDTEDKFRRREKRAIYIKYIVKLKGDDRR